MQVVFLPPGDTDWGLAATQSWVFDLMGVNTQECQTNFVFFFGVGYKLCFLKRVYIDCLRILVLQCFRLISSPCRYLMEFKYRANPCDKCVERPPWLLAINTPGVTSALDPGQLIIPGHHWPPPLCLSCFDSGSPTARVTDRVFLKGDWPGHRVRSQKMTLSWYINLQHKQLFAYWQEYYAAVDDSAQSTSC